MRWWTDFQGHDSRQSPLQYSPRARASRKLRNPHEDWTHQMTWPYIRTFNIRSLPSRVYLETPR
jgi:hypothetical protein